MNLNMLGKEYYHIVYQNGKWVCVPVKRLKELGGAE